MAEQEGIGSKREPHARIGFCSVSLRQLEPEEFVCHLSEVGAEAVEWGADIHVPAGDLQRARSVRDITTQCGLTTASYGSYFHVGRDAHTGFESVVATCKALGADRVRLWLGTKPSKDTTRPQRLSLISEAGELADRAAASGLSIAFEFHEGSLNDTAAAALDVQERLSRENVSTYWQPTVGLPSTEAASEFKQLGHLVSAVHLFSATQDKVLQPLGSRRELWETVLSEIAAGGRSVDLLVEFVEGNRMKSLELDIAWLRSMASPNVRPDPTPRSHEQ